MATTEAPIHANIKKALVDTDERGTPLHPEPLRTLELWSCLDGWGLVHVGAVREQRRHVGRAPVPGRVDQRRVALAHFAPRRSGAGMGDFALGEQPRHRCQRARRP